MWFDAVVGLCIDEITVRDGREIDLDTLRRTGR